MAKSDLEAHLDRDIRALELPEPEREYRFHPQRKWRFDMAWPAMNLAAEINGGTWSNGRHNRGSHMANEYEKLNEAALHGWRVLQFTGDQVRDGSAVAWLARALE
jgi:hypothetical protein